MSWPGSGLSGYGTTRKLGAPSSGSNSSPRLIPSPSGSDDDTSNYTADENYGSYRVQHAQSVSASIASSGQREPTRSSVHLSYRGALRTFDIIL